MQRPKEVIVVSNFSDEHTILEDNKLAELLGAFAPAKAVDLKRLSASDISDTSVYAFRCIFGESGTVEKGDIEEIYATLDDRKVPYINVFNGKGDQQGKAYLPELYRLGYAVVPTFLTPTEALVVPAAEYVMKPLAGGSSKGQIRFTMDAPPTQYAGHVTQPVMDIAYETSYLFIDNVFQHALKTRAHRWDMVMHDPTAEEIAIAERFVAWNPIKGIQRVDCLWTKDGQQLLLELEDWCPYLSLFETEDVPYQKFVQNLAVSLGIA